MSILKLARVPAVTVRPSASIMRAIRIMKREKVGILFVVEDGRLLGAISERDIMFRVVLRHQDAAKTRVRDAMTSPAISVPTTSTVHDAIHLMMAHRVRRLAVVGSSSVEGMVSLRHMLRDRATQLGAESDAVLAYCLADGIGG